MAQDITFAGEQLFTNQAQLNQALDIDTFIFANVPGQDPINVIDRNEGLPPVAQRVHTQAIQQKGKINDNIVVYSTVLDSVTGPFEFNWVGLYSSVHQKLIAVQHIPSVNKTTTVGGAAGNTLNRNFGIQYSGIATLTDITVDAQTWQLDLTARLQGMDTLHQQLAREMNGDNCFEEQGFEVNASNTLNSFKVSSGYGYLYGLRVESSSDVFLTAESYPQNVYIDAWLDGDAASTWKPQHEIMMTNQSKSNYIDGNGKQHYVLKIAVINGADDVEDLRILLAEEKDSIVKSFKTVEKYKESNLSFNDGKLIYLEDRQAIFTIVSGTDSANGFSKIANEKIGQSASLKSEIRSIKALGAKGNGLDDDTDVWGFFKNNGGNFIEAGKYLVSGKVKNYEVPTHINPENNNHSAGYLAFESNSSGYSNVAVGYRALQNNTEGFDNLALGVQAMKDNTIGNRNTAVGTDALAKNTTGDHNLALGQNALGYNTVGTYNTALGIDALEYGENCNFNVAIGQYAALNLESSNNNTVMGYNTFQAATSGNGNVAYGFDTLRDQSGVDGNTAIGTEAARDNKSGKYVTAIGYRAARSNTSGSYITAVGDQAASRNNDGLHNIAIGFSASYYNVSGMYNVAIGDNALLLNKGSYNIAIGGLAGYNIDTDTASQNTFIGHGAGYNSGQKRDALNTTAVGRGAFTTKDNTIQLGNPSVVGVGVGVNKMEWLNDKPTMGTWARGSIVWNLAAVSGGIPGWQCVSAGTPGVWKAMANLAE